ncbi:MAG: hypothetical protein IT426_08030 [Pirellulales bacterium]|nr:hypothetical protein [Pirellulales bacterium]
MDRFIDTITGTISTLFGKVCRGNVVVALAIRPECLRLHARSLRMRHSGAICEGFYPAGLFGGKPSLAPATAWQRPGPSSRRSSPVNRRTAERQWLDGTRAGS